MTVLKFTIPYPRTLGFFAGVSSGLLWFWLDGVTEGNPLTIWVPAILGQGLAGYLFGTVVRSLQKASLTDHLTGLYNRRYYYSRLEYEIAKSRRYRIPLSVVVLDVDNFKNINDTYGHSEGDLVLQKITRVLKSSLRQVDTVCRWGGEEFAILLPSTQLEGALVVGERIRSAVTEARGDVSVSVGVAQFLQDAEGADDLMKRADQAMYSAKSLKNAVASR